MVTGALGAVAVTLSVSGLGYIPWFAGASLSVLAIPAIVGAVIEGPVVGVLVGAIFGLTSLVQAAVNPAKGPLDVFFVNPLISVLPRLFIGLAAWAVFRLFKAKFRAAGAAVRAAVPTAYACLRRSRARCRSAPTRAAPGPPRRSAPAAAR